MRTYIIAEIGINFNGSIENCYKLIDSSVEAGCNAAKFQVFSAKNLYPKTAGELEWKDSERTYSYDIYKAVEKFELPIEWIESLIRYCEEKHIDFMASVFDIDGLTMMVNKGMKVIKLSSYTITHIPLIEAASKTGLPIIMSTGGANLGEIEEAVNTVLNYHNKLTLLHCSIAYPTQLNEVNMGVLDTFKLAFPMIKIGYSDHTEETDTAPVQAVYLGATTIEKHITLDRSMEGPDHFFALEPLALKTMVHSIRKAEQQYEKHDFKLNRSIYGTTQKKCYDQEKYLRDFAYMTLFSNKTIKKGHPITIEDISILRRGKKAKGLEPKYLALFQNYFIVASRDICSEDPIQWNVLNFDDNSEQ